VSDVTPPPECDGSGSVHRARGLRWMLTLGAVALTAGACTSSGTTSGTSTAATFPEGSPWTGTLVTAPLPPPVHVLTDVACVTSARCWAVGSTVGSAGAPNGAALITTADGGATWTGQTIPPQVAYLSSVSCSDLHHCRAVGQAAPGANGAATSIATSDGGTTWTLQPGPAGVLDITAVTCRPDRRCVAIGTTAGGSTALVAATPTSGWTPLGPLPPGISGATSLSCTSDRSCWVTGHIQVDADHVNGVVAVTTDGGTSWLTEVTPRGLGYLNAVSCLPGPTQGAGALPARSTTTVPPSTTAAAPPPATAPLATTSTTAPAPAVGVAGARCTVVGTSATVVDGARAGHAVVLTTDNGGATWANQSVAATAAALSGVSCTALATCMAVGSTVAAEGPAGIVVVTASTAHPWRRAPSVSAPLSLSAVSCVSISSCVSVGESISEHLSGG
jgi:hypothetical protein